MYCQEKFKMASYSSFYLLCVVAAVTSLIPGSVAQMKLDFCGSTEVPSLKCVMNPGRFDMSIENRTVCFCAMIQGSIPTYNCIKADGRATMDDLQELVSTIRNLTNQFPSPLRGSNPGSGFSGLFDGFPTSKESDGGHNDEPQTFSEASTPSPPKKYKSFFKI